MENFKFVLSALFNQFNQIQIKPIFGRRIMLLLSCLIVFMLSFTDINAQFYTVDKDIFYTIDNDQSQIVEKSGINADVDNKLVTLYRTTYGVEEARPRGLCTADMNQDGNIDVITGDGGTGESTIRIWLNNGTGMLIEPSPPYQTTNLLSDANLISDDFNNDGFPDIVQGTNGSSGNQNGFVVFMNDGEGALLSGTMYNSANEDGIGKVAAADFDKDGNVDIVISDHLLGITVYFNNGAGVFVNPDVYNSTFHYSNKGTVFTADFNNDGNEDIILNGDKIFINNGAGVFDSDVSIGGDYYNVCVGDFDADGNVDVVTKSTIYWGDGAMGFTTQELTVPVANINGWTDAGDIDGDGLIDIVQGVGGSFVRLVFYFNQGSRSFSEPEMYEITPATSWLSQVECADINKDGVAEALIAGDGAYYFECFSSTPFVEHDALAWFADMPMIPAPSNIYGGDDLIPTVPFQNEIAPRLEVRNMGQHTEEFNTTFQVLEEGSIIYEESLLETFTSGESRVIDFSPWQPLGDIGTRYEIKLFTDLTGDEFNENDTITDIFTVNNKSVHSHSLPIQNAFGQAIAGEYFAKAMRLTPLAYPAQITEFKCLLNVTESDVPATFCIWSDANPDNRDEFELGEIIWSSTVDVGLYNGWYEVSIPETIMIQSEDVEFYIGAGWPILNDGMDIFPLWTGDVIYAHNRYGNSYGTGIDDLIWSDSGYRPHICGTVKYFSETNTDTDIITFSFDEQTGSAVISTADHTVDVEVAYGTDLTSLTPAITVSAGATINPLSGVALDFTSPQTYTVTAEDGITDQDWTVTVTVAVGIEDLANEGIMIYPNPSNGVFNVNVEDNFTLEIIDITGKLISTQILTGNSIVNINNSGVYLFRLSNDKRIITKRVVVQ